jgi:hypothetical protein
MIAQLGQGPILFTERVIFPCPILLLQQLLNLLSFDRENLEAGDTSRQEAKRVALIIKDENCLLFSARFKLHPNTSLVYLLTIR